jgi:exopolyphosphatase/guanosine-5'-triphosphate,3'-diphosphate pyrophosphatase
MTKQDNKTDSIYYAAVDLGSNSFHMVIARYLEGQLDIIDRVKEMVQIARGIDDNGHLSMEAQKRALDCLKRFGERIKDIPSSQIRAVGTKTLRSANKSKAFVKEAEKALGASIQIISGYEEARLVYTGLANTVLNDHNHRLVVDIGGGSTEFIIGQDYDPHKLESLSLGCVTFTERYLKKKLTRAGMNRVYQAACSEIEVIRKDYKKTGWVMAYGTSGTIKAISSLVQERDGGAIIRKESLDWLAEEMHKQKSVLDSQDELRKSVLPAGIAILQAIFDQLEISTMHVADAALKEGLLYDTLGRLADKDVRKASVLRLQQKYNIYQEHADRVARAATNLWKQIEGPALPGVSRTKILRWAAQLHEIGLSISHSSHQNHGYYILRYSDIAGFGRYEQYILANLVRSHRKSLSEDRFEDMDNVALAAFIPLLVCLRLAVLIHRGREPVEVEPQLSFSGLIFTVSFPAKWLKKHPLTKASLELEREYFGKIGIGLDF